MEFKLPAPKLVLFWWALGFWLAGLAMLLLANWQESSWSRSPTLYILCLILLPWHLMLALGLVAVFPKKIHAAWIVPVLCIGFTVGCWLMIMVALTHVTMRSFWSALALHAS